MRRSCGCNFLYGLETNQDDKTSIQKALKAQVELKKEIMFYKKNGKQFISLIWSPVEIKLVCERFCPISSDF